MDNKRTVIGMVVAVALFFGWLQLVGFLQRKYAPPPGAAQQQTAATQPAGNDNSTTSTAPSTQASSIGPLVMGSTQPATTQGVASAPQTQPGLSQGLHAISAPMAESVAIGSAQPKDPNYSIQVNLNARGAGIDVVTLNQFNRTVKDRRPYVFQEPYADFESVSRPLSARSVTVNGNVVDLSDVTWQLEKPATQPSDASSATYSVMLADGNGPVCKVTKTYRVYRKDDPRHKGEGYEITLDWAFTNLSAGPLEIAATLNGPTMPPPETERGPDQHFLIGYREAKKIAIKQHAVEEFKADKTTEDFTFNGDKEPALWVGTGSVYFNALVLPATAPDGSPGGFAHRVEATWLNPGAKEAHDRRVALTYSMDAMQVKPGETVSLPVNVFFGPRWREVLNKPWYTAFPRMYELTLVVSSGPCGYCTFTWLINLLVSLLTILHWVFKDWGLAIIGLVIIVRAILHPITKRSQAQMMKMGKLGPEMERLKKKYGDDKEELNKAMMQFYKQQGATPILGCLPMFLQMPIFIALWSSLQSTFELRHSPFLWGWTWIKDLAQPDRLITFSHPVNMYFFSFDSINLLPILVAIVTFINQKYTPKPMVTTPEQEQQQKMMQWMTLIFPLIFYKMPAGLNLYYLTSTSLGIWEGKVIRDHIKQKDEENKSDKVLVDAKPTRGSRRRKDEPEDSPKRGLLGFLSDLQAKAEQLREQDRRGKGKA